METINVSPIQGQGWGDGYCHSIGNDLYVFGGSTSLSWQSDTIDNIFKYNPNDKWTSLGTLPQVQGWGVALYDEPAVAIYLVGGFAVGALNTLLDTIYVFDVDSQAIKDTWTMKHARYDVPAEIINDHLYVFGGHGEDSIPFSSIEICAIPPLITVDPTTVTSAFPTRHPSISPTTGNSIVSPSNTPSKHPSKRPTVAPSRLPSSPTSHPSLRTEIPSLMESMNVTHDVLAYQSSISPTTVHINASHNTFNYILLMMMMILLAILSSVVAVALRCFCKLKNKEGPIKSRQMVSNLSVIPLEKINTSDGNINVAMVLKGSARMTRGQIHDETTNVDCNHDNMN
eukprot:641926_1